MGDRVGDPERCNLMGSTWTNSMFRSPVFDEIIYIYIVTATAHAERRAYYTRKTQFPRHTCIAHLRGCCNGHTHAYNKIGCRASIQKLNVPTSSWPFGIEGHRDPNLSHLRTHTSLKCRRLRDAIALFSPGGIGGKMYLCERQCPKGHIWNTTSPTNSLPESDTMWQQPCRKKSCAALVSQPPLWLSGRTRHEFDPSCVTTDCGQKHRISALIGGKSRHEIDANLLKWSGRLVVVLERSSSNEARIPLLTLRTWRQSDGL